MEEEISLSGNKIKYFLYVEKRKTVTFKISSKGLVILVPENYSKEALTLLIYQKSRWILSKLEQINRYRLESSAPISGESGDEVYLLGKAYPIVLKKGKRNIFFQQNQIVICEESPLPIEERKKLLERLIYRQAEEVLPKIFKQMAWQLKEYFNEEVVVKMRSMQRRWGSCHLIKREITLNVKLIHFPQECIEMVVAHELAHLRHPNHSKIFYQFLEQLYPSWKQEEKRLAELAHKLIPKIGDNVEI